MKKPFIYGLVDCNNFFASCERVFRPDLTNKPVAVLSNNDGCIIARSNEVKALNIPMAVPLFKVRDIVRAHDVILFSANFELYGDMSRRITDIIREAAPYIEVYSIDESFIDLTELAVDDYELWAKQLADRITQVTGVPVSIGISTTKTLAKAASEYAKKQKSPDAAVHVAITPDTRQTLIEWLPIADIWGIGWRTVPRLHGYGIRTAADLARVDDKWALRELTVRGFSTIKELRGEATLSVDLSDKKRKTIASSRSFGHTINAINQLESVIASFTAVAAAKLRLQSSVAGSIVTYLRTSKHSGNFRSLATITTLGEPSADTARLITAALSGLNSIYDPDISYQKAGVVLLDIMDTQAWQLSLTDPDPQREPRTELMRSLDALNRRFGPQTLWHASEGRSTAHWRSRRDLRSPRYTTHIGELPRLSL